MVEHTITYEEFKGFMERLAEALDEGAGIRWSEWEEGKFTDPSLGAAYRVSIGLAFAIKQACKDGQ